MALNDEQRAVIQENIDKLSSLINLEQMHSLLKQYFTTNEIQQFSRLGRTNKIKVEAMCNRMMDKNMVDLYSALCKYLQDKKESYEEMYCLLTCRPLQKSNGDERIERNDKGIEADQVSSDVYDFQELQQKVIELKEELKCWHSCVLTYIDDGNKVNKRDGIVEKTPVPFPCPYKPTRFSTTNSAAGVKYCVCAQQQLYLNQANCGSCGNVMHPETVLEGVHLPSPCGEYVIQWRTHQILKNWYTEWWKMVNGSDSSLESCPLMLPRQLGASVINVRIRRVDKNLYIESKYDANNTAELTTNEIKCFTKLKLYLIGVQTIAHVTQLGTCQLNQEYQTLSTFSKMSWNHFDPLEPPLLCLTICQPDLQ